MRIVIAMPFRSNEPSRLSALVRVREILKDRAPMADDVVIQDDGASEGPFNRGKARNRIVRDHLDADVIVICDGDSYPEQGPLMRAILAAAYDGKIHFPFTKVHQLDQLNRIQNVYGPSAGGCYVARPDAWVRTGWMDERGGWSLDDRSFLEQMKTFGTGPEYHPGVLTCLWHARGPETRVSAEVSALIDDYLRLSGNYWEMREYVARRDQAL